MFPQGRRERIDRTTNLPPSLPSCSLVLSSSFSSSFYFFSSSSSSYTVHADGMRHVPPISVLLYFSSLAGIAADSFIERAFAPRSFTPCYAARAYPSYYARRTRAPHSGTEFSGASLESPFFPRDRPPADLFENK